MQSIVNKLFYLHLFGFCFHFMALLYKSGKFQAMRIGEHLTASYPLRIRRGVVAYFIAGHTRASLQK